MKCLGYLVMALGLVNSLWCQSAAPDAVLDLGLSARTFSLGRAAVALSSGSNGIDENPAVSAYARQVGLNGMGVNVFGLASYWTAGATLPLVPLWCASFQVSVFSVPGIPRHPDLASIPGQEARRDSIRAWVARGFSTFQDRQTVLFLNLSRRWRPLVDLGWQISPFSVDIPLGMNLRWLNHTLDRERGTGYALDVGLQLRLPVSEVFARPGLGHLTLGLLVRNGAGSRMFWTTRKVETLPTEWVQGIGYELPLQRVPVRLRALLESSSRISTRRAGLEVELADHLAFRLGTDAGQRQVGGGLRVSAFHQIWIIDYTFSSHPLGALHHLGLEITP
ncbi:MAG: hypothetical protein D6762_00545 [Candidatus Neomarinimicrobiota bacterium]|nr:MAG: hypothetical protein D6762_00545 [Candidatus Neomarinimicrobiota bacterium]